MSRKHYMMPHDCIGEAPSKRMQRNPVRLPDNYTADEREYAMAELAYRRGAHQAIFFVGDAIEDHPELALKIVRAASAGAGWLRRREADIGYWDNWITCGLSEVLGIGRTWSGDARPPQWRAFVAEMRRGLLRHARGKLGRPTNG